MIVVKTKMETLPESCSQCDFYWREGAVLCTATDCGPNGLGGVANDCPLMEIKDDSFDNKNE